MAAGNETARAMATARDETGRDNVAVASISATQKDEKG